jgi:hypothetical protein
MQLGEIVDETARAALEMLVRHRGKGQPRKLDTPPFAGSIAQRVTSAGADAVLMEAAGAGGRLLLLPDRIRILHTGFRGLLGKSLPDEQELPLERVANIDWRTPRPLRLGRIRFQTASSADGIDAAGPENEVMFYLHQEARFREIKAAIEDRVGGMRPRPQPSC